jgi:hypothetical protein
MGKLLYFAVGVAVGGGLVAWYFKNHALELTVGGIAEKLGASPETVADLKDFAGRVQGLSN